MLRGGFVLNAQPLFIILVLTWFVLIFLMIFDSIIKTSAASNFASFLGYYWTAYYFCICVALAGLFFGLAKFFLYHAENDRLPGADAALGERPRPAAQPVPAQGPAANVSGVTTCRTILISSASIS